MHLLNLNLNQNLNLNLKSNLNYTELELGTTSASAFPVFFIMMSPLKLTVYLYQNDKQHSLCTQSEDNV